LLGGDRIGEALTFRLAVPLGRIPAG